MNLTKAIAIARSLGGSSGSGGGGSGGGGGSVAVSPKEVNFYDYDGTCVHAYTVSEAQKLTELPAGPEHPGLVFHGWNWPLDKVKSLTRAMNIGAMYNTDDDAIRLYITLLEGRTSPMLGVGVNGTVTVDWGDGTEPDVLTGTSTSMTQWTPNHTYTVPGDYVIRLMAEGDIGITGSVSSTTDGAYLLSKDSASSHENTVYRTALRRIVSSNKQTFYSRGALCNCNGLKNIVMSSTAGMTNTSVFQNDRVLEFCVLPNTLNKLQSDIFNNCFSLQSVALPYGITSVESSAFSGCSHLRSVTIPDSVTSIGTYVFQNCNSLASVTLPKGLTKIQSGAFASCFGMAYYDFTACTSVPSLSSTNAFSGIPADCEIRVPAALYDEWIAATNWATYASQIVAY